MAGEEEEEAGESAEDEAEVGEEEEEGVGAQRD